MGRVHGGMIGYCSLYEYHYNNVRMRRVKSYAVAVLLQKLEICHLVIWAQGPQNRMTMAVRETTRDLGWQWW